MGTNGGEVGVEALVAVAQPMTTVAKFMWPIPDRGLARRLRRIIARRLFVFGADYAFIPPGYAQDFAAAIPNAVSTLIPGAEPMVPGEEPDAVLAAIEEFLG